MNKEIKVGLPNTPATFEKMEESNIYRIMVTFGGGMGGGSRDFYCKKVPVANARSGMFCFTDIMGSKQRINPRFVVFIEEKKLVKLSIKYDDHTTTFYLSFDRSDEIKFIDKFDQFFGSYKKIGTITKDKV